MNLQVKRLEAAMRGENDTAHRDVTLTHLETLLANGPLSKAMADQVITRLDALLKRFNAPHGN
ncbi:hypothetical protein OAS86_06665 [Gammaproteobacteria bacterium]|nr:hypothetical protein [Gammaproteobacteria bacterium]